VHTYVATSDVCYEFHTFDPCCGKLGYFLEDSLAMLLFSFLKPLPATACYTTSLLTVDDLNLSDSLNASEKGTRSCLSVSSFRRQITDSVQTRCPHIATKVFGLTSGSEGYCTTLDDTLFLYEKSCFVLSGTEDYVAYSHVS
jgi:hypothetical protein